MPRAGAPTFDFPPIDKEQAYDIVDAMRPVAAAHDATVPQVALAWLLAQPAVSSIIIGARKIEQLDDNLKSVELALSPDELKAPRRGQPPQGGVPGLDGQPAIGPPSRRRAQVRAAL